MVQILLGLEHIHHHNIIHRDIKPCNVLIFKKEKDMFGKKNVAKICDFGLAKPYTYQGNNTPSIVTSWYRAPEIALDIPSYDYKSDVWSMGCVLFEMIAQKALLYNLEDDNNKVISAILGILPQALSSDDLNNKVMNNPYRKVKIYRSHRPLKRKSFLQRLSLTKKGITKFNKEAGDIAGFCDLLEHMLCFDWDERYTISQCLDHPFFSDYHKRIGTIREEYSAKNMMDYQIYIKPCVERQWMSQIVTSIFNRRNSLEWYSHRAIFLGMDLFDRYLYVMFQITEIPPNARESQFKGFIHDRYQAELRLMVCIYLAIKYYTSIQYAISFTDIVADEFKTPEALLIAEEFESSFIKNCLEYNIYRPTVYEIVDMHDDHLVDVNIRDLIILYSMNKTISGKTPNELYEYYRTHLRDKEITDLLKPMQ